MVECESHKLEVGGSIPLTAIRFINYSLLFYLMERKEKKKAEEKDFDSITMARSIIFFLDAFLALMIITGASFLIQTNFGRFSLWFGFFMLILTFVLWVLKKW